MSHVAQKQVNKITRLLKQLPLSDDVKSVVIRGFMLALEYGIADSDSKYRCEEHWTDKFETPEYYTPVEVHPLYFSIVDDFLLKAKSDVKITAEKCMKWVRWATLFEHENLLWMEDELKAELRRKRNGEDYSASTLSWMKSTLNWHSRRVETARAVLSQVETTEVPTYSNLLFDAKYGKLFAICADLGTMSGLDWSEAYDRFNTEMLIVR